MDASGRGRVQESRREGVGATNGRLFLPRSPPSDPRPPALQATGGHPILPTAEQPSMTSLFLLLLPLLRSPRWRQHASRALRAPPLPQALVPHSTPVLPLRRAWRPCLVCDDPIYIRMIHRYTHTYTHIRTRTHTHTYIHTHTHTHTNLEEFGEELIPLQQLLRPPFELS